MATVTGSAFDDSNLLGTAGDDLILGGVGQDTLVGVGGRDTLDGADGNDSINGGPGDDFALGSGGADTIDGRTGYLDTLIGGDGDDIIFDGHDPELQINGVGNVVVGGDGAGLVDGGAGNDFIVLRFSDEWDTDDFTGTLPTFSGVYGSTGDDTININGGYGTGYAWLGQGNDAFTGGRGHDIVLGGKGADFMLGNGASDTIDGENGLDFLIGGRDDDLLVGQAGDDSIWGDQPPPTGDDVGYADYWKIGANEGDGNDTLLGGQGNDMIIASGGDDLVYGGGDSDTLWSVDGNDRMFGDAGRDFLYAGKGQTSLTGGSGFDTYYVGRGDGPTTIVDSFGDDQGNGLVLYWGTGGGPYARLSPDDVALSDNSDGTWTFQFTDGTGVTTFDANAVPILNIYDVGPDLMPDPPDQHVDDLVYIYRWNGIAYEPWT